MAIADQRLDRPPPPACKQPTLVGITIVSHSSPNDGDGLSQSRLDAQLPEASEWMRDSRRWQTVFRAPCVARGARKKAWRTRSSERETRHRSETVSELRHLKLSILARLTPAPAPGQGVAEVSAGHLRVHRSGRVYTEYAGVRDQATSPFEL